MNLEAKLNGVFLHSEVVDYRNIYEEGDTVEFKYKNFVPAFAPAGNYQIIFNFVNTAGNPEGCLSLVFKL